MTMMTIHLEKEEQIQTPRYTIYKNDSTKSRKGVVVAVRNSIKTISVEISRYDEVV